jgi:HAD superfamily phosphatase (TIGR01681 family)
MPLLILDFDRTLSAEEIGMWHDHGNMLERGFGGAARVDALRTLLAQLDAAGVIIAIVSYNSKKVICKALKIVKIDAIPAARIWGHEAYEDGDRRWSKSKVIASQLLSPLGVAAADVLFVDDDPSHVTELSTELGVRALLVPRPVQRDVRHTAKPLGGMQRAEMDAVRAWAASTGCDVPSVPAAPADASGASSIDAAAAALRIEGDAAPASAGDDSCRGFVPKRASGPLARRCLNCGEHETMHRSTT